MKALCLSIVSQVGLSCDFGKLNLRRVLTAVFDLHLVNPVWTAT